MNLYVRYFDREALFHNSEEVIAFLSRIDEIGMDDKLANEIREYAESDVLYPKRVKVRPRAYFIIIKTTAETMADFKAKKGVHPVSPGEKQKMAGSAVLRLSEQRPGWYEGDLNFKRVVTIPATGKHEYRDTRFVVRCKAMSGQDCYDRMVENLQERVDRRSQFPSAKGKNFHFKYLGMWKQA
ncbi:MAG: hypothetical protein PUD15_08300 [Prevotella sp.]|uniref:hypothetical protein n=1 Tax=Prevotella sp. AGR2160 TaxID=1280674 RepID=UPI00040B8B86|nr:hypothetical protein [Prevotella sp. AGR2160]MDD5862535.1 hypothetical protein [Prevotella sp.]